MTSSKFASSDFFASSLILLGLASRRGYKQMKGKDNKAVKERVERKRNIRWWRITFVLKENHMKEQTFTEKQETFEAKTQKHNLNF